MQIVVIGSDDKHNRAEILEALAKIKPEFSVIFSDTSDFAESSKAIRLAHELHDLNYSEVIKKEIYEFQKVDMEPIEYIPNQRPKYTCKGILKRR